MAITLAFRVVSSSGVCGIYRCIECCFFCGHGPILAGQLTRWKSQRVSKQAAGLQDMLTGCRNLERSISHGLVHPLRRA